MIPLNDAYARGDRLEIGEAQRDYWALQDRYTALQRAGAVTLDELVSWIAAQHPHIIHDALIHFEQEATR